MVIKSVNPVRLPRMVLKIHFPLQVISMNGNYRRKAIRRNKWTINNTLFVLVSLRVTRRWQSDGGAMILSGLKVTIHKARGPSVNRGSRHTAQGLLIHLVIPRTLTAGLRGGTMSQWGTPAERRWPRALSDPEWDSLSEGVKVLILLYSLWHKD